MSLLIRQSLWYAIGGYVASLLSLLFWLIYARFVSISDLDKLTLAISFGALLGCIIAPAINYALLKLVPEDPNYVSVAISFYLIVTPLILAILLILYASGLVCFIKLPFIYFTLTLIYVFVALFWTIFNYSAIALMKAQYSSLCTFITYIIKLVLPLIFLLTYYVNGITIFLSMIVALACGTVFFIILMHRELRLLTKNIKRIYIYNLYKYSLVNAPERFFKSLMFYLAPYLLSLLGYSEGDVSSIYLSLMILTSLLTLPNSIAIVLLPILKYENNKESNIMTACRLSISFTLLLICFVLAVPKMFFYIIKPDLLSKAYVLKDLSSIALPETIILIVISVWNRYDKLRNLMMAGLFELVLFVILAILFSHLLLNSLMGIILSLIVSLTTIAIYMLFIEKRLRKIALKGMLIYLFQYLFTYFIHLECYILLTLTILSTLVALHLFDLMKLYEFILIIKYLIRELYSISKQRKIVT